MLEQAALVLCASTEDVKVLATSVKSPPLKLDIRPKFRTKVPSERCNSHARTKFGKDAITRIFRASGALDRLDSDVNNYLFLTATLPGDTDEAKWGIAEYSHEIIDGLKSWLSKRLQSRNEFYVWENQKRGALHFHYCVHCPDREVQAEITRNFKRQMVRLYDGIKRKHGTNLWGKWSNRSTRYRTAILQARTEVVYKSVGAYMAGYLSGKGTKHSEDEHHRYYPKRWFGVSRPLSALIKAMTEKDDQEFTSLKQALEYYGEIREELLDDVLTYNDFPHKVGEGKTGVFYHTPEIQAQLWSRKKAMKYKYNSHPVITDFIQTAMRTTLQLQSSLRRFKYLEASLPARSVLFLQDSSLVTFMRNGQLNRKTITELEVIFSSYDFASDSRPIIKNCFLSLRRFNLLAARYFPQMTFDSQGFLAAKTDWIEVLDSVAYPCYVRTNTSDVDAPNALDGGSGLVPRPLGAPSYDQLECLTSRFLS